MYFSFQSPSLATDKLELQAHLSGYRVDVHVQLKKSRRVASSTVHQLDAVQDTSNRNPIFLSFSLAAEKKHRGMSQLQWGDGSGIEESTESQQLSFPSFPVLVLPNIRGTQVSRQQRNLESRGSAPPRIAKPNK